MFGSDFALITSVQGELLAWRSHIGKGELLAWRSHIGKGELLAWRSHIGMGRTAPLNLESYQMTYCSHGKHQLVEMVDRMLPVMPD